MVHLQPPLFGLMSLLLFFSWPGLVSSVPLMSGLADPAEQSLFTQQAPNALDPSYLMTPKEDPEHPVEGVENYYVIGMSKTSSHETGIVSNGKKVSTTIFGYSDENGDGEPMWPGKTILATTRRGGGPDTVKVQWENNLDTDHILPVDTSLHWCYGLEGYQDYSIESDGVPVIPHLHGGQTDFQFDGDPEAFFSPG